MVFRPGQPQRAELERRYDESSARATQCSLQGRFAEARQHSADALAACRELSTRFPDDARHRPVLAAALYNYAGRLVDAGENAAALALLAESAELYAALAADQPRRFTVRHTDVLVRTGRVLQATGDTAGAVDHYRRAIRAYADAPTDDPLERDLGLARAQFGLGRCLLQSGSPQDALAEIDAGLFAAERVREEAGIAATDFSWLAKAPASFQYAAPDWAAGAVCAMELHDAAGRRGIAADAANIAVRVSAGLAAMGGAAERRRYEAILARAQQVWADAANPPHAAARRAGPAGEGMAGGGRPRPGPAAAPDVAAILRRAGWEPVPGATGDRRPPSDPP